MRISGLIVALLVLTGCQSLTRNNDNAGEPEKVTPVAKIERGLCLFVEPPQGFEHNCDATYWLNAWIDAANQPWLERKQALKALGDTASDTSRLRFNPTNRYTLSRQVARAACLK